ncbi:DUF1853 family protein [uncultured Oxalicibacterium sp.]|uniref:DUF1853 family protein n=1 Tax=uncultured Oxalicibacterium sp. TaxID=1168540 RepID=UPI0025DE7787|nr:DUF1853 family protein [uncultured Oxalicibacterium sp.]
MNSEYGRSQREFHRRWGHLLDPHVRGLAWLLDAPDLLDATSQKWQGRVASLADLIEPSQLAEFLAKLDANPAPLISTLNITPYTRLGRYAESLLAFYLHDRGWLTAHGLQVRDKHHTVGEFDFLLQIAGQLVHWEFATKFYLLESSGAGHDADYFVGPNLADTLGAKMHKIFDRQLHLAAHPAAAQFLPAPVSMAQALVKGWLFYRHSEDAPGIIEGLHPAHCRGFWCACAEMTTWDASALRYMVLPRLSWLAPACCAIEETITLPVLEAQLQQQFLDDTMPVMVACMEVVGDTAREVARGFVVPDDWRTRAGQRIGLSRPRS